MAEFDFAAHLHTATETAYNNLVNDLSAIDEGTASRNANPAARPAIKLVAECASVNSLLAALVTTGQATMLTPEERTAFYDTITTPQDALSILKENTHKLYAAIDGTSPETWGETVPGPFGPWTRAAAAGFASLHMMYHDGQLNYEHLLSGDTEMHWK